MAKVGDMKGVLLIAAFAVALLGGYLAYNALVLKKQLAPALDCYKVWDDLGKKYLEVEYNKTLTFKDPVEDSFVSGVNVYVLEKKPYYWGQYGRVASIISGKTPVATTGSDGKATVTFTTPESKNSTKTYYIVATARDYWSDMYTYDVKFKATVEPPLLVRDPVSYCKDLSLFAFIDDSFKDVLTGKTLGDKIELHKIGTPDYDSSVAMGVPTDADQNGWEKKKSVSFSVSDGYFRIDEITITPGSAMNIGSNDYEGIHRIEITLKKGTNVIEGPIVVFDDQDTTTPLIDDGKYVIKEFNGKDVLELAPDEGISIEVKVVADTETTATADDGRLGPGEEFLNITFKPAHPRETTPITVSITG